MLKEITTKDGSVTYHSAEFDETHHSISGAREEALKKFVLPCEIGSRDSVSVLDVCFGLGYNSAAAVDAFNGSHIRIVGLENNASIVGKIVSLGSDYPFECFDIMKDVAEKGCYESEQVCVSLVMGDALDSVTGLSDSSFDVVFHDPFSPKKCPELWTLDFFRSLFRVMKSGGVLATYSCARFVRENLVSAGFTVRDGPVVGRRGPGTLAIKE